MISVGLTGGIGSGKTTVAKIFAQMDIPVYNSDQRAKDLYTENEELRAKMMAHFGNEIYLGNQINRAKLAQIVFSNPQELTRLNGWIHPLLQQDFEFWMSQQTSAYVLREAAILIESGAHKMCDFVVVVSAKESIRVERVMVRDSAKAEDVQKRIANQITDQERLKYAQFEIINDGSRALIPQVLEIHKKITSG